MRPPQWFKKLAVPLANKIVYASDAYVGLKSTVNDLSSTLIDFSRPPAGPADERLLELGQLIRPWTYEGLELIRVGGAHDGGYIMANDFTASGAISIGVGQDVSWDQTISQMDIPVAMFDPTVRRLPASVKGGRFFRVGLGSLESGKKLRTLNELVDLANFAESRDLILKVDVEGSEWDAFENVEAEDLERFSQMVFEMHNLGDLREVASASRILAILATFFKSHLPVHAHANNYDELVRFDSNWFPNSIELSYVRRDLATNPLPSSRLISVLDAPCDPRVADIVLDALVGLDPS